MKQFLLFITAIALSITSNAQTNVNLTIQHKLGNSPFALNQASTNNLNNDFTIDRVDYYISKISIIHDGGMQTPVTNKYILVTGAANVVENLGAFNVTNVEGVKFYIGVDSVDNMSDPTTWSLPHPLAPRSPVMHWGWASGYRFVALEGKSGTNLNNGYTMHGLFNRNYFSQTVMAAGVQSGNDININLDADYNEALRDIDVSLGPSDHGNDMTDLDALKNFRDHVFSPGAGFPLATSQYLKTAKISVYPNPSSGELHIEAFDIINKNNPSIDVLDVLGKKVMTIALDNDGKATVNFAAKGMYFLVLNDGGVLASNKIIII